MSDNTELQNKTSHRRRNAFTGEWVLVSPHRLDRPWQGEYGPVLYDQTERPSYDENCYLCAGNKRASGQKNPDYDGVLVFDNDFAALQSQSARPPENSHPLFTWAPQKGVCRVITFSPDHSRTLSQLNTEELTAIVGEWAKQTQELGAQFPVGSVQIFENKGELMGCSQPHPHGQIWAQESVPTELWKELNASKRYLEQSGSTLLGDYVALEEIRQERLVFSNEHFIVVVPYWATWPFETLVCPKRQVPRLTDLTVAERRSFADCLQRLSIRYDNLFGVSFPYSAGIHQAPASERWDAFFSLHMHFYPPLLRSAGVKKFMVGYEMLAEPQRDLTPESAAKVLRELSEEPGAYLTGGTAS